MTARSWEVWRQKGFADIYLSRWGDPRKPPETWEKGQLWRTRRATELIVGQSVLDVGCGAGHLYALLTRGYAPQVAYYVGIDDSEEMLGFCREAFPEGRFELGDVYDLSKLPVSDSVCCLSVLLHLPDPWDKPLSELWSRVGKALVFNTLIDDANPRLEKMDEGLLYNVSSTSQVLKAAEGLPKVAKVESWLSNVDGSEGREFAFVRCMR